MAEPKLGVENLKKAYALLIALGMQIEKSSEGGFQKNEIFDFFDELMLIPGVANSLKQINEERKDLDAAERAELNTYIETTFNIANDQVEEVVEASSDAVLAIMNVVNKIGNLRPKTGAQKPPVKPS